MSEKRRPPSLHRGAPMPPPDPDLKTVVFRMSTGQPYTIMVTPDTAREIVENLSDCWDGVSTVSAPRLFDDVGTGFIINPAHVVAVDVR